MKKAIVLYQSKYGATKKYAEWLSDELNCEMRETKSVKAGELKEYGTVILGGGIYASGIAGMSFLKKNYDSLKDKKLAVFAVGASPYDEKALDAIKKYNFKGNISEIPCFYCRGAWNEKEMSFKDKALCGMLKAAVSKKDPSEYEPWEKALVDAIGRNSDWTDKNNLNPLIEYIRNDG